MYANSTPKCRKINPAIQTTASSCHWICPGSPWRDLMEVYRKGWVCSWGHFLLSSQNNNCILSTPFSPVLPHPGHISPLAREFFPVGYHCWQTLWKTACSFRNLILINRNIWFSSILEYLFFVCFPRYIQNNVGRELNKTFTAKSSQRAIFSLKWCLSGRCGMGCPRKEDTEVSSVWSHIPVFSFPLLLWITFVDKH